MSLSLSKNSALVVNEMQLGVVDAAYTQFRGLADQVADRGIITNIAHLAAAFRTAGRPVFHTPVVHRPDFADVQPNTLISALTLKGRRMARGSVEAGFVQGLAPAPGDHVIERTSGLIAFQATALDGLLRRLGVDTVVVVGVSTNVGVAGCTMAAVELGYNAVIPEDCIAGADPEAHRIIVDRQLRMLARISTSEEVIAALAA